jgi:WhiB family redox-sensing transcriptional regulator
MNPENTATIAWFSRAKCRGEDPDIFFPDPESVNARSMRREAERYCSGCPVIVKCAEYALKNGEVSGVWGGTAGWSYRHRKENMAYIERLKLTLEYERLCELPESNSKRVKIAKILKQRNAIKVY